MSCEKLQAKKASEEKLSMKRFSDAADWSRIGIYHAGVVTEAL